MIHLPEELEVVEQVKNDDVFDRDLDAEAATIGNKQGPNTWIAADFEKRAARRWLCTIARGAQLPKVAVRRVLRQEEVRDASDSAHQADYKHRKPPAHGLRKAEGPDEQAEEHRHRKLRHATTKVAPTGGRGIGSAD